MAALNWPAAKRVTAVTAIVVTLGAIAGAITGLLAFTVLAFATRVPPAGSAGWTMYATAAGLGAIVGAMIGTPVALLFLRSVPLWRATLETAGAAGLGTAAGAALRLPYAWAYGALLFSVLAAMRLRYAFRARPAVETDQRESRR
jgi:hypothetical protein